MESLFSRFTYKYRSRQLLHCLSPSITVLFTTPGEVFIGLNVCEAVVSDQD